MNNNFWLQLKNKKPFFCLAPMADVTDCAFREIIRKYSRHGELSGGPDVFWTEFVSADGLVSGGQAKLLHDLSFTEGERPIVAQLFSSNPEKMRQASKLVADLGFDGIDINMGCPDKSIEKQGAGASMIKNKEQAGRIIQSVKDGINDAGKNIPVSVKTRVGYNTVTINDWISFLLKQNIATLTVHARTRKEMSKVPARWEHIKEIVQLRDKLSPETLIIGNGDVTDIFDGQQKAKESGCDGVMIGRAIFGNPWLFDSTRVVVKKPKRFNRLLSYLLPSKLQKKLLGNNRYTLLSVSKEEKLKVLVEHAQLFEEKLGKIKHFSIMKKHFKAYIQGFNGAKELRQELMEKGDSAEAVQEIIQRYLQK